MDQYKSIQDISVLLGVTSRTLRYWEEKGLFQSKRDSQSGWRFYDEKAEHIIRLVSLLRELDISIKNIKTILDSKNQNVVVKIMEQQIEKLNLESKGITKLKDMIYGCLIDIKSIQCSSDWVENMKTALAFQIYDKETLQSQWEEIIMTNDTVLSGALRIVNLPEMRFAVCNVISSSPEDEALSTVIKWAENEKIMGTARIFGFNTTPYTPESKTYGWAAGITIPESVKLPGYLEEKRITGGIYASLNSTNEVYDSWQTLMRLLKENNDYDVDQNRLCLEEHIPSGESKGDDFYITLLEPVLKK